MPTQKPVGIPTKYAYPQNPDIIRTHTLVWMISLDYVRCTFCSLSYCTMGLQYCV